MRLRLVQERLLQTNDAGGDATSVLPQIQPEVGGDLVVATAPGTQLSAQRAEAFDQPALERCVHVLVVDARLEPASGHVGVQLVETGEHRLELAIGEEAGSMKDPCVGSRSSQVVGSEP